MHSLNRQSPGSSPYGARRSRGGTSVAWKRYSPGDAVPSSVCVRAGESRCLPGFGMPGAAMWTVAGIFVVTTSASQRSPSSVRNRAARLGRRAPLGNRPTCRAPRGMAERRRYRGHSKKK